MNVQPIDPNITFLHLDSWNQPYETVSRYSTFAIIPGNRQYSPSAYNITFKLKNPIPNIKRVYLKSLETAFLFDNIRASSLLNTLIINCNGTLKTLLIPDGTYTSLSVLVTALNALSTAQFASDNLVFAISTGINAGNLQVTSTTHATLSMETTNLSSILGFRKGINTLSANTCIASYKANLSHDTCFYVYIPNIGNANSSTNTNINSSYKIILSATSGVINFATENLAFSQFINVSNPTTPISEIHVVVVDHLGYTLNSMGAEMAISLALSTV